MSKERSQSPDFNPQSFDAYMATILDIDLKEGEVSYINLVAQGMELLGEFQGPYAERVEEWREEGLGRMIQVPQVTSNVYEKVDDETHYQDFFYALPFTEHARLPLSGALLIFPGKANNDVCEVKPKQSVSRYAPDKRRLDEQYRTQFNAYFAPGTTPAIHQEVKIGLGEPPIIAFKNNADKFAAVVSVSVDKRSLKERIDTALKSARRLKGNK